MFYFTVSADHYSTCGYMYTDDVDEGYSAAVFTAAEYLEENGEYISPEEDDGYWADVLVQFYQLDEDGFREDDPFFVSRDGETLRQKI